MSPRVLKLSGSAIVVLGSFNPSILQPAWFSSQKLITTGEATDAEVQVVHKDITAFGTEYWDLECTADRLVIGSDRAPAVEILRDLAIGIFTLLSHTPVHAVGLNRSEHWDIESADALNSLGYRLVPKENWTAILETPAMQTLTVQGARPDDYEGYIRVKVEPSVRVENGVYLEINDHYQLVPPNETGVEAAGKLIGLLSSNWKSSRERAQRIIEGVLDGQARS
jgi:hypothetical protein